MSWFCFQVFQWVLFISAFHESVLGEQTQSELSLVIVSENKRLESRASLDILFQVPSTRPTQRRGGRARRTRSVVWVQGRSAGGVTAAAPVGSACATRARTRSAEANADEVRLSYLLDGNSIDLEYKVHPRNCRTFCWITKSPDHQTFNCLPNHANVMENCPALAPQCASGGSGVGRGTCARRRWSVATGGARAQGSAASP